MSHSVHVAYQDRTSDWFDFTSFQEWSRKQHPSTLKERKIQKWFGRITPQTNEEYGYEDHYPMWAEGLGSDSVDTLRQTVWDIVVAEGYQTTGESARRGTNAWPDTGDGWMNSRGDDSITMLEGYAHMVDFFTSFEWWKTEPHDDTGRSGKLLFSHTGRDLCYLPAKGWSSNDPSAAAPLRGCLCSTQSLANESLFLQSRAHLGLHPKLLWALLIRRM